MLFVVNGTGYVSFRERAAMNEQNWHYECAGKKVGPFRTADLQRLVGTGLIQPDTVLVHDNGSRVPASDMLDFDRAIPTSRPEEVDDEVVAAPVFHYSHTPPHIPSKLDSVAGEGNDEVAIGTTPTFSDLIPLESYEEVNDEVAIGTTPIVDSSEETTDLGVGMIILGTVLGVLVLEYFVGWGTIFFGFLWLIVIVGGLAALFFGIASLHDPDDHDTDDRIGFRIIAGICAVIAFGAWVFIPTDDASRSTTQIAANTANTANTATNSAKSESTPRQFAANPATKSAKAELTPRQFQAKRTLAYWNGLRRETVSLSQTNPRNAQDGMEILNSKVRKIEQLPAAGVDEEAIRCGAMLREWLTMFASEVQRRNSPEFFIEAFAKGYQGDMFGPFLEFSQTNAAVKRSLVALQNQCATTRAVLSSRHGIEFPPL